MNLVYKSFTTINHHIIHLLAATVILFSISANAQQCATISFSPIEIDGKLYVTMIAGHNEKVQKIYKNKASILAGTHQYYLAEGKHILNLEQWSASKYEKLRYNNRIHKKYMPINQLFQDVQINVIAGQHYQFELLTNKDHSGLLKLKTTSAQPCTEEEDLILSSKKNTVNVDILNSPLLPRPLEYRLRRMMTKLDDYHPKNIDKAFTNWIPSKFIGLLGTFIDDDYSLDGNALKVLSVLPYSLANKLKLVSGDNITHLNDIKIKASNKTPNQQFDEYFSALNIGEEIKITVQRNNKEQTLTGDFMPMITPALTYQVHIGDSLIKSPQVVINSTELPEKIEFEFKQLMLHLSDYYLSNGVTQSSVVISRDKLIDTDIGLSGGKVALPNSVGLAIEQVTQHSFAEKFGLKKSDIIVKINNINITEDNINTLVNSLPTLKSSQQVSLTVQRKGRDVILKGTYEPITLVGFHLAIDLQSIQDGRDTLSQLKIKYNKLKSLKIRREAPDTDPSTGW